LAGFIFISFYEVLGSHGGEDVDVDLVVYNKRFGETYCPNLHLTPVVKMEAICSSETLVSRDSDFETSSTRLYNR
jgi:hypothetical protein